MMPPSPRLTLKGSLESKAPRSTLYVSRRRRQGQGGLGPGLATGLISTAAAGAVRGMVGGGGGEGG